MNAPTAKTVFITGASGNLGRAVAAAFLGRGSNVVLVDRHTPDSAPEARTLHIKADLMDASDVEHAARQAIARFDRIDVLCNLAGGFRMGPAVHETPDADWNFLLDLNAKSIVHTARAIVPSMIENGGGKIVNIAAGAGLKAASGMAAYSASKSAVIRLTEAMSAELKHKGINVNCVMPSTIDTPENRKDMPDANFAGWVSPMDLANVIAFLASDEAKAIHGAALPVNGLV